MADYYTPWGEASQGFDRLGSAAGNVLLQLAQNRAGMARAGYEYDLNRQKLEMEREQNRERGALYKAQSALAQADEALTKKKADEIQVGQDLASSFGTTIENLVKAQQGVTPLHAPSLEAIAAGQAGQMAGAGLRFAPQNLSQLASFGDPRLRALMATDTRIPASVNVNEIPLNAASGQPMNFGTLATPPGYTLTDRATGAQTVTQDRQPNEGAFGGIVGPVFNDAAKFQALIAQMQSDGEEVPAELQSQANIANQLKGLVTQGLTQRLQKGQTNAPASGGPAVGEVRKGYNFKGGNPADKNNWEKVQ
jgi:hypothetical protein